MGVDFVMRKAKLEMGKSKYENRNAKLEMRNTLREPGMIGPG